MRTITQTIPLTLRNLIEDPLKYLEIKKNPIPLEDLEELQNQFLTRYSKLGNVVMLKSISKNFKDLSIIGDTHGELNSSTKIIKPFLDEEVKALLFLGDYIHADLDSFLNLILIFSLAVAFPNEIILLRGNHEDIQQNIHNGLSSALEKAYGKKQMKSIEQILEECYGLLPLVAITPSNSVCMHAGLPRKGCTLEEINAIPRPHREIENIKNKKQQKKVKELFDEIRWNDPIDVDDPKLDPEARSYHGYYFFGEKTVKKFLQQEKMKRIIRSHESQRGNFQIMYDGLLLHLMSMKSETTDNVSMGYYFGEINKGYILHETTGGATILRDLEFNLVHKLKKK